MSNILSDSQLVQVLSMLAVNDTNTVKNGEAMLKPFLKQPSCIPALLNLLSSIEDVNIQHHSALLIKRKLKKLYTKFNEHEKFAIKIQLFQLLIRPYAKVVGISIAGSVAVLASCVMKKDKQPLPELFQALTTLSQSPNDTLRSLNYSLLAQLAEQIPKLLIPHTDSLCQMLNLGCQDASQSVCVEAMGAATIYIDNISGDEAVMKMKPVLSSILHVLNMCIQKGDEDIVIDGLEIFQQCANMDFPLINDHMNQLVPFLIHILQADDNLQYSVKRSAAQTLNELIEYRPKLFGKLQLVTPCLEALVMIIAKSRTSAAGSIFNFQSDIVRADADDDEDDDEDEEDSAKLSQTCINNLAIFIPSKYFTQPALNITSQCISSPDAHTRKAGCALLGIITEGCSEAIRPLISDILPRVIGLTQDSELHVRECAVFTIGQFSEHCQPEILQYYSTIFPAIVQTLDDPSHTVRGTSCYVIEVFVENLEPRILRPYLSSIMTKLLTLLCSNDMGSPVAKEIIISAIAATSIAAEIEFLPYMDLTIQNLSPLLFLTEESQIEIRGRALECLGHIAIAVGESYFAPHFEIGMQSALQATKMNNDTIKEFSYIFIANCAKAMGNAFVPVMPTLIPHLLEVILQEEMMMFDDENDDEEDHNVVIPSQTADGEDEDDDDDGGYRVNVEEGFINSKKGALTALGALAQYTTSNFYPYLEESIKAILDEGRGAYNSLHPSIRAEAASIMPFFVRSCKEASELRGLKPVKGETMQIPSNSPLCTIMETVMSSLLHIMLEDEEKESVACAIEGIDIVIQDLGIVAITEGMYPSTSEPIAQALMKGIFNLLSEKLPCQLAVEDNDGTGTEEDNDDKDHDKVVIDSMADLIGTLAKYLGRLFVPYFDQFCTPLSKYLKPTRSYTDRAMAIGIFAEVILEVGPESQKYLEPLIPAIQAGLVDPIESVRRNAAFCVATVVESLYSILQAELVLQFLQWLHPICTRISALELNEQSDNAELGGADVDNAISAVARMVTYLPQYVPMGQVLPVLISSLPLRVDPEEGLSVYGCILKLLTNSEPTALSILPQILSMLAATLQTEAASTSKATKALICDTLRQYVLNQHPVLGPIHAALQQLNDPAKIQVLQQVMNASI